VSPFGPTKKNICAVIVTYHPAEGLDNRVAHIANQVSKVVIVDNHSLPATVTMLQTLYSKFDLHLILNTKNLGVATAFNQGIRWAIEHGFEWSLMFDQDSVVNESLFARLMDTYALIEPKDRIGVIGLNFFDSFGKDFLWRVASSKLTKWIERKIVITSGSLISTAAFNDSGGFRNDFFIDMVDHEYCLRLRSLGYKVFISCEPLMTHPIGNKSRHRFLWGQVNVSNHSALRKYYMTRNRLVLARLYLLKEPVTVMNELRDSLYSLATIALYEEDKLKKYKAILLGIRHALQGHMGKLNVPL
jgi:rhamnosyltransferase